MPYDTTPPPPIPYEIKPKYNQNITKTNHRKQANTRTKGPQESPKQSPKAHPSIQLMMIHPLENLQNPIMQCRAILPYPGRTKTNIISAIADERPINQSIKPAYSRKEYTRHSSILTRTVSGQVASYLAPTSEKPSGVLNGWCLSNCVINYCRLARISS
jgi:hypothetical protein